MKLVLQRVKKGSVAIDGKIKGSIGCGFVALVGFGPNDDSSVLAPMADKMLNLRVFEDDAGKMNLSLLDVGGSVLSISQFTLYAPAAMAASQFQRRGRTGACFPPV